MVSLSSQLILELLQLEIKMAKHQRWDASFPQLSPGITKQFVDALEPFLPSSLDPQVEFVKFLIVAVPWIMTVVTISMAPHKILGLTIYVIIFVLAVVFITDPTTLFA